MPQLLRMPQPKPSAEELEASRAKAMTAYQRSEWVRRFLIYGGMAALVGMHRREHMLILRPTKDCLVAHTMFYANEVRPAPRLNSENEFSDKELTMATALIKGYSGEFNPAEFKDLYQERIHKIIEAQISGIRVTRPAPAKPTAKVPDLMEQIRLSLAQIESKKSFKESKKPAQKTSVIAKKKPQKVRA